MILNCICRNPECYNCFNVVITGAYVDQKDIKDSAEARDFKLCGDYWYCDRCETPEDELVKIQKQLEDQQKVIEEKEKQIGRLRFENSVYQDFVMQTKKDIEELKRPFKSWWNKITK